ncbi:MAG: hypothetical protein EKK40_02715 [Bradyrhizobiaceae bacterium]|nr:MAG: hypothetical protein EKK40_02715 [Bradyrhizobiaceae bacterium]
MTDTTEPPITHPEEMRGEFDLRIGEHINIRGAGRTTPANVVTVGIMITAVLLAAAVLVKAARR